MNRGAADGRRESKTARPEPTADSGGAGARLPRVLVVDDERAQADLLSDFLTSENFDVRAAYAPDAALVEVGKFRPDVVISDYRMPGMNGLQLYQAVAAARPGTLFIIITAFGTVDTAVAAMRAGVFDFLTKPVDAGELVLKIQKALRVRTLEDENVRLRAAVDALRGRVRLVAASRRMKEIFAKAEQVAQTKATVLITGESGTGKELIAKAIHTLSPRHTGPYVKINCAAMPENLLEDELFGHKRGAYTGADADRKGKFEAANGGTIFLDEIGEMPLHLQPKLLRVLQEREVEPLGSNEVRAVDVRVLTATNRDLREMTREGKFREDLFYRLNVVPLEIPPLRERPEDVPALAEHFLTRFCEQNDKRFRGFTKTALEKLASHAWPGNVRELKNAIERAAVFAPGEQIDAGDLVLAGEEAAGIVPGAVDVLFSTDLTLDRLEREIITEALKRNEGNLSKTARKLGLTRRALQYRVEKIRQGGDPSDGGEPDEGDA